MELTSPQIRKFKKLRVSITEQCNLSCMYCDMKNIFFQKSGEVDLSLLLKIIENLHKQLDLSSIRLTGGEPALHPDLPEFIRELKKLGIPEVNLTTNGYYLKNLLPELKNSGLDRINISLDAIDEDIFANITGQRGATRVMDSILAANLAGFKIKINSIIMRGINESQILSLLEFAMKHQIIIRFLELMKMGSILDTHDDLFYSQAEIISQIQSHFEIIELPRQISSTASYFYVNNVISFGIIANHSQPFCQDCDRLRLDHLGNLYGCLSNPVSFALPQKKSGEYKMILENLMALKQKEEFTGSNLNMRQIGG